MKGNIIALVGPSGVGKNYLKLEIRKKFPEMKELTVLTTRPARSSDGIDRKAGLKDDYFIKEVESGEIIAAHQPFAELGYWYGFSKGQIDSLLDKKENILTEVHVDNVEFFRKKYADKIVMIGIIAALDYLDKNIRERGSETVAERLIRLQMAENENDIIKNLYANKIIDKIFEANSENRETLSNLIISEIEFLLKKPIFEEMRSLK